MLPCCVLPVTDESRDSRHTHMTQEAAGPCGYAAGTVRVAELDWSAPLPAAPGGGSAAAAADAKQTEQGQQQKQQQQQQREGPPGGDGGAFGWTAETAELLRDVTAVFAADLIYDDDLTGAATTEPGTTPLSRRFSTCLRLRTPVRDLTSHPGGFLAFPCRRLHGLCEARLRGCAGVRGDVRCDGEADQLQPGRPDRCAARAP